MTERRAVYGAPVDPVALWGAELREEGLRHGLTRLFVYPAFPWISRGLLPFSDRVRAARGLGTVVVEGIEVACERRWGERTWELPFARRFAEEARRSGRSLLEVGNVLGPPYDGRTVIDRYERSPPVVSEDLLEYAPPRPFDRIMAISTLEHVGFDEPIVRPGAFRRSLARLVDELLAPEGRLVFTVPLGYNPEVDAVLENPPVPGLRLSRLARRSWLNDWEIAPDGVRPPRYSYEWHAASWVAVGTVDKPGGAR